MDAFEALVCTMLERQGLWVRSGFKVELTKAEKRKIGRPSSPRWELDVVAYEGDQNRVYAVECKSYLDSRGVTYAGFDGSDQRHTSRYKLFNDRKLRSVVLGRLAKQLASTKACRPKPEIRLCLVAGRICSDADRQKLHELFERNGWQLWDERWIKRELEALSKEGYQNDVAAVVAKLLLKK